MRLAVISDIHGNLPAFDAVLADLDALGGADLVWHLGDYIAFGPYVGAIIDRVRGQIDALGADRVRVIGGNTDRYIVTGERFRQKPVEDEAEFERLHQTRVTVSEALHWNLAQLSWADYRWLGDILGAELRTRVEGYGTVIGVHAVPGDDEIFITPDTPEEEAADYLLDRQGRLALGGHTHQQMDRLLGGWRMINPGSVGASVVVGKAQWALLTFDGDALDVNMRSIDYDTAALKAHIMASDFPLKQWALKRLGLA